MRIPRFLAPASVALGLLAAAAPSGAQFRTELVAGGLDLPLFATAPPNDTERLFVVEWPGRVRVIKNGVLLPDPFLDITDIVYFDFFERGLLGMAFDPDYDQNGWFYLYFINNNTPSGSSVIRRFTVTANPDSADRNSIHKIFTLGQLGGDHNGGHIEFGPNGMLWLGLGDGGIGPNERSQEPDNLFGKMIRIDPYVDDFPADASNNYGIPADNPYVGDPSVLSEIWAFGLRNPYRFSFDPPTGDLYIGDVGQADWEEIDWEPGGSPGGRNYGWPFKEATHCYRPPTDCDPGGLTDPVWEYSHAIGFSVTGGRVYRGSAIPGLTGHYFFGDFILDSVWTFRMENGQLVDFRDRTTEAAPDPPNDLGNVVAFGEDAAGELYIVDLGGSQSNGEVYKIVPDPDAVDAPVVGPPASIVLSRPFPNPFSADTRVDVSLAGAADLDVGVYSAAGRLVRRLHSGPSDPQLSLRWDGRDARGARVPAGIYFFRAKTSLGESSERVTRLR